MASVNEQILEETIRHAVGLQRYGSGIVKKIIALLKRTETDLVKKLIDFDLTPGRSEIARQRLQRLLDSVREIIQEGYNGLEPELRKELLELADYESEYQQKMLQATVPVQLDLTTPTIEQLVAVVQRRPFNGSLLSEWAARLEENTRRRVSDAISIGFTEGETVQQIVQRVRGTRANNYKDGILEVTRREAEAIVRTAVSHVANGARDELFRANTDIIKGVKWVSTLDSRTCLVAGTLVDTPCGRKPIESIREGEMVIGGISGLPRRVIVTAKASSLLNYHFTLRNGAEIQTTAYHLFLTADYGWIPAHLVSLGYMLSSPLQKRAAKVIERITVFPDKPVEVFDIQVEKDESFVVGGVTLHNSAICRARDGEVYPVDSGPRPPAHWGCRSGTAPILKDWRSLGIDEDELPPGTRASIDGQVPEDMTYGEWLRKRSRAEVEDIMGKTKAKLFLDGNLPLDRFVSRQGDELTIAELKKRDADAFRRAGLS
jgi:hypothetical protein